MDKTNFVGKQFQCFLCSSVVEVKMTKKAKPYWICSVCGLQVFIRQEKAIKYLLEFLGGKDEKVNAEKN
ncbi:MAG: hypothetical protein A3J83_03285 [Elusimicrobia bacterium RIFOXYA2_FULL_40_6]|nr:MAG: hypothetical protein A3J83_03285 [Elusimicrobia bacterium RIFOXYA2_FULL_40_6]